MKLGLILSLAAMLYVLGGPIAARAQGLHFGLGMGEGHAHDGWDGSRHGGDYEHRWHGPRGGGGNYCRRLRWQCQHKYELGEEGLGNCRRYREECG